MLSHVKPLYLVQVLEHPSPSSVFPSSHCLEVLEGMLLFPHIYVQGAVLLIAVKKVGQSQLLPERMRSLGLLVLEHEVQVVELFSQVKQGDVHVIDDTEHIAAPVSWKPLLHKHFEVDAISIL